MSTNHHEIAGDDLIEDDDEWLTTNSSDSEMGDTVSETGEISEESDEETPPVNPINTSNEKCRNFHNTTKIESLANLEILKKYTDDADQLPNAEILIYIMSSETDVRKVVPFTKPQLEKLTDHHYFSSLKRILTDQNSTFRSFEKHPGLGTNITCLKIPGVKSENVYKCLQFISKCADEKLMSIYLMKTPEIRFQKWICENYFEKQDESVFEAYKIFDFLGAQVYVELAKKLFLKFEKYCENNVGGLEELESRCGALKSVNLKHLCRIESLESQNKKLKVQNEALKTTINFCNKSKLLVSEKNEPEKLDKNSRYANLESQNNKLTSENTVLQDSLKVVNLNKTELNRLDLISSLKNQVVQLKSRKKVRTPFLVTQKTALAKLAWYPILKLPNKLSLITCIFCSARTAMDVL